MNPFDWRGPQFLAFYVAFTIVALIVTRALRRSLDGDDISLESARSLVSDPYALAYLRGGAIETLRVALMALIDRGIIVLHGGGLKTADGVEPDHLRRNVERTLVTNFLAVKDASSLDSIKSACDEYKDQLQRLRLIPNDDLYVRRFGVLSFMILVVGGVGFAKVLIGMHRDRPVGLLVALTIVAMTLLVFTIAAPRTKHGDAFLRSMRTLFSRLERRSASIEKGGATADLALLAAVFGVNAVPNDVFPLRDFLFPPRRSYSSSSSSCSSGSGCSSGCGGGGGCGGCGGCGGD